MTRINCIPVHELCDKHLLSEYRELPRIFSWLEKVIEKGKEPTIPEKYCLGKGHEGGKMIRFFIIFFICMIGSYLGIVFF